MPAKSLIDAMDYNCHCDYDPPIFYGRAIRTARKQHKCEECAGQILPGEQYEYVSGRWEDSFSVFKTCQRCIDLRQWTINNVPCVCWSHGNTLEDCWEAVEAAAWRAPAETVGLRFGFLRRRELIRRHNRAHKKTPASDRGQV